MTIQTNPISKRNIILLVGILVLAFWLRAGDGAHTAHYRYDQAQLSLLTLDFVRGESIPMIGITSSAGVPNSPMTVYALAIPYFFTSDPQVVTVMIAIWNVIAVGILWWITHRYLGATVAFWATLAYAVSPYAVLYSRSIWAQDYHTTIILLAIALGLYGFLENKRWAQILTLPILMIGVQIHFAAFTLLPLYVLLLWMGRKSIRWRWLPVSIALAVLTLIPFAIGISQQPQGTGDRLDTIIGIITYGITFRWEPVQQIIDLTTGWGRTLGPTDKLTDFQLFLEQLTPIWGVIGIGALAGLGLVWRKQWRPYALFIWVWAGITLAVFLPIWTGSGVYHHYFIPTIPVLLLLCAFTIATIIDYLTIIAKQHSQKVIAVFSLLIAPVFITQFAWALADQSTSELFIVNQDDQTTTPIHYLMDVREALKDYDDVILLGANPHESNYYVWEPMLYDTATCVRDLLINGGGIDILPAGSFAAVVAPLNPINANYIVPERYQNDQGIIMPLREGEDPYIIYPFTEAPAWDETPIIAIDPIPYSANVALTGYYLGETFIQLRWQVLAVPGGSYSYFVHFMNEQGERVAQRDAPFYVGQHWCLNDTLITTVDIAPLEHPITQLRVGLYTIKPEGGTTNQDVLDANGNPIGQWAEIPVE